jgi:hypothetical protein
MTVMEISMKFAVINGQRHGAQPRLSGQCPSCGRPTIAKCGEVRIWHWAHQGSRVCDPWWENETEWHRAWKERFPVEWQEVVHVAENGTKHIADVKTERGWVIEFQHSCIEPDERQSRGAFYPKLVWVVDGTRRKRDQKQFVEAVNNGARVAPNLPIVKVRSDECALLREWVGNSSPIFFDFGSEQALWWLIAGRPGGPAYVGPISRGSFIEMHRGGVTQMVRDFNSLVKDFSGLVADYESYLRAQAMNRSSSQCLRGFQRYLAAGSNRRRRF